MRLSGEATLHAPVPAVFAALHDPRVLVATIPGCQRLERAGADAYRMVVRAGVGAVTGVYTGDVLLCPAGEPDAFILKASGAGAPGTVSAEVSVRLAAGADGATRLTYDADAEVGGMIGGVGQRMLASVARRTADEFFAAVDRALAGPVSGAGPADAGAAEAGAAVSGGAAEAPVAAAAGGGGLGGPTGGAAIGTVFTRAATERVPSGFLAGALVGGALALLGVLVGGLIGARAGRRVR